MSDFSILDLIKVAFLVWVFVRTQKVPAIVYAVHMLLFHLGVTFIPIWLGESSSTGFSLLFLSLFSAVIEVILFIWLILSLMKRSRLLPVASSPVPSSPLPSSNEQ